MTSHNSNFVQVKLEKDTDPEPTAIKIEPNNDFNNNTNTFFTYPVTIKQELEYPLNAAQIEGSMLEEECDCEEKNCSRCAVKFHIKIENLNDEILNTIQKFFSFPCAYCGRSFRTHFGLVYHMKVKHFGFNCMFCGLNFLNHSMLNYHLSVIHNYVKRRYNYTRRRVYNPFAEQAYEHFYRKMKKERNKSYVKVNRVFKPIKVKTECITIKKEVLSPIVKTELITNVKVEPTEMEPFITNIKQEPIDYPMIDIANIKTEPAD